MSVGQRGRTSSRNKFSEQVLGTSSRNKFSEQVLINVGGPVGQNKFSEQVLGTSSRNKFSGQVLGTSSRNKFSEQCLERESSIRFPLPLHAPKSKWMPSCSVTIACTGGSFPGRQPRASRRRSAGRSRRIPRTAIHAGRRSINSSAVTLILLSQKQ